MDYDASNNFQNSTPLNIIGVEKADEGEIEAAIRYFTEAIEVDPNDARAYFNRATLRVKIGDIQGARADFSNVRNLTRWFEKGEPLINSKNKIISRLTLHVNEWKRKIVILLRIINKNHIKQ